MQVILLQPVKGLGAIGTTVEVAPGYARNYLFPRRLAEPATDANVRRVAEARVREEQHAERERESAQRLGARLDGTQLVVHAKAGESGRLFGSVTAQDVADALAAAHGAKVDRRRVLLDEPLKSLGDHPVTVRLHPEVSAHVTVRVEPA